MICIVTLAEGTVKSHLLHTLFQPKFDQKFEVRVIALIKFGSSKQNIAEKSFVCIFLFVEKKKYIKSTKHIISYKIIDKNAFIVVD